jgi:mono/diheme cytochrome c family protein
LLARGRYLARIGNCALCHSARGSAAYAGGRALDTPFGKVYSSNLTPDPVHGIGRWSADDFWRALHQGLSQDGHALYPVFPYPSYSQLSRADSDALFRFLQSVPAAGLANQAHALRWPVGTQPALLAWRALFFRAPAQSGEHGDGSAALQRGRYLVQGLGHCLECHGQRNALGALTQASDTAGWAGSVLPGSLWFAPALTDPPSPMAQWSEAELADFLQTGSNGRAWASGPMAEVVLHGTQYLTDADARAMALYLKTLPRTPATGSTPVPMPAGGTAASTPAGGAALYEKHCADCHGLQGQGRANAYPALAGNPAVLRANSNNLVHLLLEGGFAPATARQPRPYGMPPFVLQLSDREIAAVLSYIRSAWGNRGTPLNEFDINKLRRSLKP